MFRSSSILLCICFGVGLCLVLDDLGSCQINSRFRNYDGSCNNLNNVDWGKINSPLRRLIPPEYGDAVGDIPRRKSVTGAPLPDVRTISLRIHTAIGPSQPELNVMLMQWGQFLDHDITHAPLSTSPSPCCSDPNILNPNYTHPDFTTGGPCAPIVIPQPDFYFNTPETQCMEFKRSRGVNDVNGVRQQINELTPWVDASHIYGVTKNVADSLRTFQNGKLKSVLRNGEEYLPEWDVQGACFKQASDDYCFKAGDKRVNVFPGLSALHTVFLRYHNQLCDRLSKTNPTWTDERLYQEARKIIGAVMQKISYDEFFPIILGRKNALDYNLLSKDPQYAYNASLDPTLSNAFSGAAYRYGHSAIPDFMIIDGQVILTGDLYMRPSIVLNHLDGVVKALVTQAQQKVDLWYTNGASNRLFEPPGMRGHGFDLAAVNIHRGRDHGLPPYAKFRKACGLPEVTQFSHVNQGQRFQEVYQSVDDIDLYSGGLSELPTNGAWVGPLYQCILREQFRTLKFADRFWYENTDDPRMAFTPGQIDEINRKVSLATILCQTTGIQTIQADVFRAIDSSNPEVDCSTFKDLDIETVWDETNAIIG